MNIKNNRKMHAQTGKKVYITLYLVFVYDVIQVEQKCYACYKNDTQVVNIPIENDMVFLKGWRAYLPTPS